jgi:putative tricarboxylic transport membrane protein
MGPILEESLRRSMAISGGNLAIFLDRPIALALLSFSFVMLVFSPFARWIRKKGKNRMKDEILKDP